MGNLIDYTESASMREASFLEAGEDGILQEDLENIASMDFPFEIFRNSTFLVSGATGLIGSLFIKALLCCSRKRGLNISIIALIRNKEKAKSVFSTCRHYSNLIFLPVDLEVEKVVMEQNIDYIIHAAAVTESKVMVEKPVETIRTSLNGTFSLLDLAADKKVRSMIYLSSMEVYGVPVADTTVREKDLGRINLENVRSCYPESKRMCECLCTAYAFQHGVNVISARLAQTFGAGVSNGEQRIFAQFAKSIIENRDIVLHTTGMSEGNYCYTRDAIKALFILLAKGKRGESYNISNESSHTTIKNMAELVASDLSNGDIKVVYDLPKNVMTYGYAPDVKIKLDASKMKQLGWKPEVGLKEAYQRTIASMRK